MSPCMYQNNEENVRRNENNNEEAESNESNQ
jgi:hypothetical protein